MSWPFRRKTPSELDISVAHVRDTFEEFKRACAMVKKHDVSCRLIESGGKCSRVLDVAVEQVFLEICVKR